MQLADFDLIKINYRQGARYPRLPIICRAKMLQLSTPCLYENAELFFLQNISIYTYFTIISAAFC